ncbi:mRNA interferase RelE/StbE [Candidatus Magnetomoraceae bacterium gMMP-15]
MYKIEWTIKAFKQLKKIDNQYQQKILVKVRNLTSWPKCQNVIALKNRSGYRLRVGRYRIFFTVENFLKIIKIEEVKKRDERTY